jgi:hypothetical protein
MTNFKDKRRAVAIIREVFEKTSEEYLQTRIDEPVVKAATSFEFDRDAPITHKIFTRVIADFVRHVHEQGLWGKQELTVAQASDEAVAILEEGYQGPSDRPGDRGYDAAFPAALKTDLGLEYVLGQMAGHIIAVARAKHMRWICASRMVLADRPIRCLIAEILLERWKLFLPENLRGCSPAQLAHDLPELIFLVISANRIVNKMFGTSVDPWNF